MRRFAVLLAGTAGLLLATNLTQVEACGGVATATAFSAGCGNPSVGLGFTAAAHEPRITFFQRLRARPVYGVPVPVVAQEAPLMMQGVAAPACDCGQVQAQQYQAQAATTQRSTTTTVTTTTTNEGDASQAFTEQDHPPAPQSTATYRAQGVPAQTYYVRQAPPPVYFQTAAYYQPMTYYQPLAYQPAQIVGYSVPGRVHLLGHFCERRAGASAGVGVSASASAFGR